MGRPRTYKAEDIAEQLNEYIDGSNDPYIEEFCLPKDRPSRDTVYRLAKECQELSDTIKRCLLKQDLRTMRGVEDGSIPASWGIFKKKQKAYGGWTDKLETVNNNFNTEMSEAEADEVLKRFGVDVE